MIRLSAGATAVLLATLPALQAQAQSHVYDEAGASVIGNQIKGIIGRHILSPDWGADYSMDGPIEVTPAQDRYSLLIPGITVEIENDIHLRIEPMSGQAFAHDDGSGRGGWDMQWPISLFNPQGGERIDLSAGSQLNQMATMPGYDMLKELRIIWDQTTLSMQDVPANAGLDALLVNYAIFEDGNGLFNQTAALELDGIKVATTDGSLVDVSVTGLDFAYDATGVDLDGLMRAYDAVATEGGADELWFDGLTSSVSIAGADIASPEGDFSWDDAGLLVDIAGLSGATGSFALITGVEGFGTPDLPPEFAPVAPSDVHLDIALDQVPNDVISAAAMEFAGQLPFSGPQGAFESAMPILMQAMASDAVVSLNQLFIAMELGYLDAEGSARPDPTAAFGAVGRLSITVAGLDEMITFASQAGPDMAMVGVFGPMVSAMGEQGTDADGVPTKTFHIEVKPDGQMLLNGTDLGAMMQGG